MDSMQDLANLTTNETPTRPEMDDSNPTRTPGLICPLAILLNEGWMNRLPGDERSQTNIMPLGAVTNDSYPTEWYSQHGIAALLRVQQEEEVLQAADHWDWQSLASQWYNLPSYVRASIIARVAGPELLPWQSGDLSHMALLMMAESREWLSAIRMGVRIINVDRPWHPETSKPQAAVRFPSPRQLSHFPNLESLSLGGITEPPIGYSVAAPLRNLKVLHYVGLSNPAYGSDYLRAVLQGCMQLRELRCEFKRGNSESPTFKIHLTRVVACLTALTSLSLIAEGDYHGGPWAELSGTPLLSDALRRLVCLQELTLCGIDLTSMAPECFSPASPLRSINLQCSSLQGLPSSFTTLQRLESLELEVRSFYRLPNLAPLSSLTCLVIHDSRTTGSQLDLCPLISGLPWLRVLRVTSDNAVLQEVPAEIGCYTSLEVLHLSCREVASLPESFGQLRSLTELKLHRCRLSGLPESFSQLQSLRQLELKGTPDLDEWPEIVELPVSLTSLEISSIRRLSDCLLSCPSLLKLHISDLGQGELPRALGRLTSLTELTVSHCDNLEGLPLSLMCLKQLHRVVLDSCRDLKRVSDDTTLSLLDFLIHLTIFLPALTYLDLRDCEKLLNCRGCQGRGIDRNRYRLKDFRISGCISSYWPIDGYTSYLNPGSGYSHLPHSLGSLASLTSLYIADCEDLGSLPDSLGGLSSLASLQLKNVGLTSLPDSFCLLSSLRELELERVYLTSLPQSIDLLSSLRVLKIRSCPDLSSLPLSIGQLGQLSSLSIACNEYQCTFNLLPGVQGQLSSLLELNLDGGSIMLTPDFMTRLPALTSLKCWGLTRFPPLTERNSSLRHLSVRCSDIPALPEGLGSLSNLESLSIQAQRLEALPESLGQLSKLTALALERCEQLKHLPDSFTQLVGLKRVWLLDCRSLVSVPLVDGQLPGSCEVMVQSCPRLKLAVNNVQTDGMDEDREEEESSEGGAQVA